MAEVQIPTRNSSQVEAAYYDAETLQMRVIFKSNGSEYLYSGVDQDTADAMANTPWNDLKGQLLDYQKL